jgi:hypothetical protein
MYNHRNGSDDTKDQLEDVEENGESWYLRGDDSVSRPTTCKCVTTLVDVCDVIHNATAAGEQRTKERAMHIISRRPEYKNIELDVLSPIPGQVPPQPCASALRMAAGLESFWDILPKLPLHEFLKHWIAFLFLRPIPVYICIHDDVGRICPATLRMVRSIKHDVVVIIRDGMWDCESRDTMAFSVIQAVLGISPC